MAVELESEQLKLFRRWVHAHLIASEAERLAAQRHALPTITQPAVRQVAQELRTDADALFAVLLESKAFPDLRPMPPPVR